MTEYNVHIFEEFEANKHTDTTFKMKMSKKKIMNKITAFMWRKTSLGWWLGDFHF